MKKHLLQARQIMAFVIVMALLFTGCGEAAEEVPALIESQVVNDAYRPVTYGTIGDIGNLENAFGTVVPEEDCYFFHMSAQIANINVEIGDWVSEGDVLATITSDDLEKQIEDLQETLTYRQKVFSQEEKRYEATIEKYDAEILKYQTLTDKTDVKEAVSELKKNKAVEQENFDYSKLLYEREIKNLKEEKKEAQALLLDCQLVARCSGYVTYVKDITDSCSVQASENVVIISNTDVMYLEVSDYTLADTDYTEAESVYTSYDGKRYDLTLYAYSQEELALMQALDDSPVLRYVIPYEIDAQIGDLLMVCYTKKNVTDVLIVGQDSLYEEGNTTFVYVKTKNSDKERREITIGAKDAKYVEVTSGLAEGDLVYYTSAAVAPVNYESVTVGISDVSVPVETSVYTLEDTESYHVYASQDMKVSKCFVQEGDTVKEGDLIFRIKAQGGKADLLEAENAIESEKTSFSQTTKDYKQQLAEAEHAYDKKIATANYKIASLNHEQTLKQLKKTYNELKTVNDGNGYYNMYAERDGIVTEISADVSVGEGDLLYTVSQEVSDKILVSVYDSSGTKEAARLGESVTFEALGKTYTGVCIATSKEGAKTYYTTIDGQAYQSYNKNESGEIITFYVKMDDDTFYENMDAKKVIYDGKSVKNAIVLPAGMVYQEKDKATSAVYYYVWKIMVGELVKQYIAAGTALDLDSEVVVLAGISVGDLLACPAASISQDNEAYEEE